MEKESRLALTEDFILREIPEIGEIFKDEDEKSSFQILKKDFIRNTVEILIKCRCNREIRGTVDYYKKFEYILAKESKIRRYKYKFSCSSCGKIFYISRKMNCIKCKNPFRTAKDRYEDVEVVKTESDEDIPEIDINKINTPDLDSLQKILDFQKQAFKYFLSGEYKIVLSNCDEIAEQDFNAILNEFISSKKMIYKEIIEFFKAYSKMIKDNLEKTNKVERNSIKPNLIYRRRDYRWYSQEKRKISEDLKKLIALLKIANFGDSLEGFNNLLTKLELFKEFPFHLPIKKIIMNGRKINSGLIKNILIKKILKCYLLMENLASNEEYDAAEMKYSKFIKKIKKHYKDFYTTPRIQNYVLLLQSLNMDILRAHYYTCIQRGDIYKDKGFYENAILEYTDAKNLVKKLPFKTKGSRIVQFLKLIRECKKSASSIL